MEDILNHKIDEYFDNIVKDLQEFIRIPSILDETEVNAKYPFGQEINKALEYILDKGKSLGLKTKNVDGYAGYIEVGQGLEMACILCHVDVVPEGSGWSVDPFGGEITNSKLYGRGSVDDKGPALAVLYGLKAINESNLPVSKRAKLIIGTDEETGGRCIKHYLEKEEMPVYGFSPDAEFPIIYAEKGILRFEIVKNFGSEQTAGVLLKSIKGGTRVNVVPDHAEALIVGISQEEIKDKLNLESFGKRIEVENTCDGILIKARGISSHACYPDEGLNAIQMILDFLTRVKFSPLSAKSFIDSLSKILLMETDGRELSIACSDDISGPLTLNTGVISFNGNSGRVKFDIRYPVTVDGSVIIEKLKLFTDSIGAEYLLLQHKPPLYVNKDCEFIRKLQNIYEQMTGNEARLISIGGGTYCRYVKNAVSFGPVFPGQKELAHQKDEYIDLDDLRKIAKIYTQAIYELVK